MRRFLTASAFLALALATAIGQPQPDPRPKVKSAGDQPPPGEKVNPKPADSPDAAIAAALVTDADVKMARAKIQLAEAELAKARQAVTLKVVMLKAKIDQLKADVTAAQNRVAQVTQMVQNRVVSETELLAERGKLEAAKAALATAEVEWNLLTGGTHLPLGAGAATDPNAAGSVATMLRWLGDHPPASTLTAAELHYLMAMGAARREWSGVKGPIPERIRTALDKPVKLGAKGEKVTFEKALEAFKEAGLDVPVRGTYPVRWSINPKNPNEPQSQPIEIVSEGEELPVGAWFQLFEDHAVIAQRGSTAERFRFYVREYGLLISSTTTAPPDAPPLMEFWKQKPPAKEIPK